MLPSSLSRSFQCLTLTAALLMGSMSAVAHADVQANAPDQVEQNDASLDFLSLLGDARVRVLLDLKDAKGHSILKKNFSKPIDPKKLWATLDAATNGVQGTSTDKIYLSKLFQIPRNSKDIIVAVIDSGLDVTHVDLKNKIWINEKELNGVAGVDDDGDGYVDDIYGWNFLGTVKDGKPINVGANTLEATRELVRLKKLSEQGALSPADQGYLAEVSSIVEEGLNSANGELPFYKQLSDAAGIIQKASGGKIDASVEMSAKLFSSLSSSSDPQVLAAVKTLVRLATNYPEYHLSMNDVQDLYSGALKKVNFHYNQNYNSSVLVGDDDSKLQPVCATDSAVDKTDCLTASYGNGDVGGRNEDGKVMDLHGTHVSGIIAAIRKNGIGIDGQAKNVKIMPIRAVPDGDERDKDVANAIRFAVDHGAQVINMSFGKPFSPHKSWVDDAVQYARSRNVLLVHAAGNAGTDTQESARDRTKRASNYPNARFYDDSGNTLSEATNWIEVGASGPFKDKTLAATFSNYGKTSVDLFAPGVSILSTIPDNQYKLEQGTSMASPETAGVAALLMNLFPNRSIDEVRAAMMNTVTQYIGLKVLTPGSKDVLIPFSELSRTGGVVNAFEAASVLKKTKPVR